MKKETRITLEAIKGKDHVVLQSKNVKLKTDVADREKTLKRTLIRTPTFITHVLTRFKKVL